MRTTSMKLSQAGLPQITELKEHPPRSLVWYYISSDEALWQEPLLMSPIVDSGLIGFLEYIEMEFLNGLTKISLVQKTAIKPFRQLTFALHSTH